MDFIYTQSSNYYVSNIVSYQYNLFEYKLPIKSGDNYALSSDISLDIFASNFFNQQQNYQLHDYFNKFNKPHTKSFPDDNGGYCRSNFFSTRFNRNQLVFRENGVVYVTSGYTSNYNFDYNCILNLSNQFMIGYQNNTYSYYILDVINEKIITQDTTINTVLLSQAMMPLILNNSNDQYLAFSYNMYFFNSFKFLVFNSDFELIQNNSDYDVSKTISNAYAPGLITGLFDYDDNYLYFILGEQYDLNIDNDSDSSQSIGVIEISRDDFTQNSFVELNFDDFRNDEFTSDVQGYAFGGSATTLITEDNSKINIINLSYMTDTDTPKAKHIFKKFNYDHDNGLQNLEEISINYGDFSEDFIAFVINPNAVNLSYIYDNSLQRINYIKVVENNGIYYLIMQQILYSYHVDEQISQIQIFFYKFNDDFTELTLLDRTDIEKYPKNINPVFQKYDDFTYFIYSESIKKYIFDTDQEKIVIQESFYINPITKESASIIDSSRIFQTPNETWVHFNFNDNGIQEDIIYPQHYHPDKSQYYISVDWSQNTYEKLPEETLIIDCTVYIKNRDDNTTTSGTVNLKVTNENVIFVDTNSNEYNDLTVEDTGTHIQLQTSATAGGAIDLYGEIITVNE